MEMEDQPVSITDRAYKEIVDTLTSNKIPDTYGLRIGIRGGGCSGTFMLGFDTQTEHDRLYTIQTIKVFIDKRHLLYVVGAEVDFVPSEGGYTIRNTSQDRTS
jgi:iron-sulfur cluster assembly protein